MAVNFAQKRLETALAYALRGWQIIPTRPNSKVEFSTKTSPKSSRLAKTSDAAVIRAWAVKHPRCNFKGIPPAGIVTGDLDNPLRLDEILEAHGDVPMHGRSVKTKDGYNFEYTTPETIVAGNIWVIEKVMELRQNVVMLPYSSVEGHVYEPQNVDAEAVEAPEWMNAAIRADNAARAAQMAAQKAKAAANSVQISDDITRRDRQYANAALINNLAHLAGATSGNRHFTLRDVSLSLGGFVHILGRGEIVTAIQNAVSSWPNQNKTIKTIDRCVSVGAKKPKETPTNPDYERAEVQSAIAKMLAVSDSISWRGKFRARVGNVQALGLRDCLIALFNRAKEVNSLDVIASVRWLAEAANMNKETAGRVIHAMQFAGLIQISKKGHDDKANVYHLTHTGFSKLLEIRRLEKSPYSGQVIEIGMEPHVSPISITCPVYGLSELGIFGHTTLGRASRRVLELLEVCPMTTVQLEEATGIPHGTMQRAVKNLGMFGFIDKGGRNQPHMLNYDQIGKSALKAAEVMDTPQRMERRKIQHALNRDAFRKLLADPQGRDEGITKRGSRKDRIQADREEYLARGEWITADPAADPWTQYHNTQGSKWE